MNSKIYKYVPATGEVKPVDDKTISFYSSRKQSGKAYEIRVKKALAWANLNAWEKKLPEGFLLGSIWEERVAIPDRISGRAVFDGRGQQIACYDEYDDRVVAIGVDKNQPGMRAWEKVIQAAAIECKCGKLPVMRLIKSEMGKEDRLCCMCVACKILGPVCSGPRRAVTAWNNKIQGLVVASGEPEKTEDPKRLRRFDLDA